MEVCIMTAVTLTIEQWGDGLAVLIPATVARSARFQAGQRVQVVTEELGAIAKPASKRELTLNGKLESFDTNRHGGEAMGSVSAGS
jgi:antitoxin MazE